MEIRGGVELELQPVDIFGSVRFLPSLEIFGSVRFKTVKISVRFGSVFIIREQSIKKRAFQAYKTTMHMGTLLTCQSTLNTVYVGQTRIAVS